MMQENYENLNHPSPLPLHPHFFYGYLTGHERTECDARFLVDRALTAVHRARGIGTSTHIALAYITTQDVPCWLPATAPFKSYLLNIGHGLCVLILCQLSRDLLRASFSDDRSPPMCR